MEDLELLFSHTFESYNKRMNGQSKTFSVKMIRSVQHYW